MRKYRSRGVVKIRHIAISNIIKHLSSVIYQTFCINSQYSTKSNEEPPREVGYGQNQSSCSFSNHERRAQTYSNTLILTQIMKKREDTQVYNRSVRVAKIVLTQE